MREYKHVVKDSKLRSISKALTGRALEIAIGTFILSLFIIKDIELSFSIAILNEALCAVTSYINDRIWNLFQWGRKVEHQ